MKISGIGNKIIKKFFMLVDQAEHVKSSPHEMYIQLFYSSYDSCVKFM